MKKFFEYIVDSNIVLAKSLLPICSANIEHSTINVLNNEKHSYSNFKSSLKRGAGEKLSFKKVFPRKKY